MFGTVQDAMGPEKNWQKVLDDNLERCLGYPAKVLKGPERYLAISWKVLGGGRSKIVIACLGMSSVLETWGSLA